MHEQLDVAEPLELVYGTDALCALAFASWTINDAFEMHPVNAHSDILAGTRALR